MKALMLLSYPGVTGPAELALSDAAALRAAGYEVLFGCDTRRDARTIERAIGSDGRPDFGSRMADHRSFALAIERAGFERMAELTLCKSRPTLLEIFRDVAALRRRMAAADVVHCRFAHEHALVALAAALMRRPPRIVRSVEIASAFRPGAGRRRLLRRADAFVVPCEAYASAVAELHGVARERLHVLPGCVSSERFSPGDGSALRRELGVQPGEVLFGIVSRIKVERRHELLIRAFARLAEERPDVHLAIVGRGEFRPALERMVADLGLSARVSFAGYRTEDALVAAYRALDVAVWLAEGNDGTCRAVLEALACGKPAIVGDKGAMAELVRDGLEGRVISLDEAALVGALREALDPGLRARWGEAALHRARTFTPERRGQGLVALYDQLFAAAPAGRG